MAELPSPDKIAGADSTIYEDYYKLVDPRNEGKISAIEAAIFLKKSHLSDAVLGAIWDMADPNSRGYLDKSGMFVALKLCALAQQGRSLNTSDIFLDVPPPTMAGTSGSSSWAISPSERRKYQQLFVNLAPVDGYIPGNKVKGVLMDSKLPLETLGKIWDLADADSDGRLNLHEFTVAMHLVYKALEKNAIPSVLPAELADISKNVANNNTLNLNTISSANQRSPDPPKPLGINEWVVSYEDQLAADKLFTQADKDTDGFVTGAEIKDTFIQTGLPQSDLAHIWNLCDIFNIGKLNSEQFALSMWLVKQKLNGIELPNSLPSEMIPPSLRKKKSVTNVENNNLCTYANQELNMINREICEIVQEKHLIEQDISQKEADIQIQSGKIKSLQSELDSLTETLRQLNNQKGQAQKGLNDLKAEVERLSEQTSEQESTIRAEEEEIDTRRRELKNLKATENNLHFHKSECKSQLNRLLKQLQNKQLHISQIKVNVTQLEEQERQIVDASARFDAALEIGNALLVPESSLHFRAKLDEAMFTCHINSATSKPAIKDQKNIFVKNDLRSEKTKKDRQNRDHFAAAFPAAQKDPFGDDPFALQLQDSPGPALPPKQSRMPPPRPAPRRPVQSPITMPRSAGAKPPTIPRVAGVGDAFAKSAGGETVQEFADFANFGAATATIADDLFAKCKLEESANGNASAAAADAFGDFDEDPFANYRYEDLAAIADPFGEDGDDFKNMKFKGNTKNNK